MITLTGQRRIGVCQVYPDDVDPLTWYFMPDGPRIALDPGGKPDFSLVWYRRDVSQLTDDERKTRLGGGILAVTADLALTDDQMKELRTTLAADPALKDQLAASAGSTDPAKLAAALNLSLVPVEDGTVSIAILAESPDAAHPGEFVSTLVGGGGVSMTGDERASFMAKLTQDGAVLLWDMLEKNLAAIRIGYDLTFNHRLNGVRMIVYCDAEKSYRAIQKVWDKLQDNASWSVTTDDNSTTSTFSRDQSTRAGDKLFQVAKSSEYTRVEIIPDAGPDTVKPDEIAQLTQIGNQMITDFLGATFLEAKLGQGFKPGEEPDLKTELATADGKPYGHHGIDYFNLKKWNESMQATLDYQLTTKAVVQGHLRPNDNIGNILQGHDPKQLRTQVEIDAAWYKFLDVQVVCTANFDDDPVNLVEAHLAYKASGAQGNIDSVKDFVFQKGSVPQRFSTYLASPDQLTYDYHYTVYYKGTSATYSVAGKSDGTVLVLDADRLGVLRVDVALGLVDWTRIASVEVKMWYGGSASDQQTQFTLDAQHQTYRWSQVIAKPVDQPYTYQLTFVDKGGQQIVLDPVTTRGKQLVVNQPLQEQLEVALVPAGSFGPGGLLSQVAVALQYSDPAHNYEAHKLYTLAQEGQSQIWQVPLMDKNLRTYQYRVTVFYSDGVTREDGWQTTDKQVLPVGDPFGWRVQILPFLLKNPPGAYQFGTIHLAFDDPQTKIHAEKDLEIDDFTKPLVWRFRLGSPDRHTYNYQLTLFKADGRQVVLPQTQDAAEVLVLLPPAPPAPA